MGHHAIVVTPVSDDLVISLRSACLTMLLSQVMFCGATVMDKVRISLDSTSQNSYPFINVANNSMCVMI